MRGLLSIEALMSTSEIAADRQAIRELIQSWAVCTVKGRLGFAATH
jgi:hypothetical protein